MLARDARTFSGSPWHDIKAGGEKKQNIPPTIHMIEQYSGNYSNKFIKYFEVDVMFYLAQNSPPKV